MICAKTCAKARFSVTRIGTAAGVNARFTIFRDPEGRLMRVFLAMSIGRDIRAITRGAQARPGAALILSLLLLTRP